MFALIAHAGCSSGGRLSASQSQWFDDLSQEVLNLNLVANDRLLPALLPERPTDASVFIIGDAPLSPNWQLLASSCRTIGETGSLESLEAHAPQGVSRTRANLRRVIEALQNFASQCQLVASTMDVARLQEMSIQAAAIRDSLTELGTSVRSARAR